MEQEWPIEPIPDEDLLYMRAHRQFFSEGELQPGVFRDKGSSMSTHWEKYCEDAEVARGKAKVPLDNGVVSLRVERVREIPLSVEHSPSVEEGDRSHTDVIGKKSTEVRFKLLDLAQVCLLPGSS